MPRRPRPPCKKDGCPNLHPCLVHPKVYAANPKANQRYGNSEYKKNRAKALRRDKVCRFKGCGSKENLTVHHITRIVDGGTHALENLITLCHDHHVFMERIAKAQRVG